MIDKLIYFNWIFTGTFKNDIPHYMIEIVGYDEETNNTGYIFFDLFSSENVFNKILFEE